MSRASYRVNQLARQQSPHLHKSSRKKKTKKEIRSKNGILEKIKKKFKSKWRKFGCCSAEPDDGRETLSLDGHKVRVDWTIQTLNDAYGRNNV